MARITVEDCLKKINNRFALIHMVSRRVRQLRKGDEPTITSKNRDIVISLREIAAGNISLSKEGGLQELYVNNADLIGESSESSNQVVQADDEED
jgi:DNA-directed RNA polymerase subunit omega